MIGQRQNFTTAARLLGELAFREAAKRTVRKCK